MKTLLEKRARTLAGRRAHLQEKAILEATILIEETMEEMGTSRAVLARKMGCTKGRITQLLDGDENKTVRTVADVLAVLGKELSFIAKDIALGAPALCRLSLVDMDGEWQAPENYSWNVPSSAIEPDAQAV